MILNNKPLSVLSASAGSGKTYNLVQHYLFLTLGQKYTPENFGKIMAMTFTNKAAWEMKDRIIGALDLLSNGERKNEKEEKKRRDLLAVTADNLQISETALTQKAKDLLQLILHSYERFQVATIDKFNLRLIRTFARDLNLNEDFEVVLDEMQIIDQVVDQLISEIGEEGRGKVTELAIAYAKTNLEDGERWDFKQSLLQFSKILKEEKNQAYIQKIIADNYEAANLEILNQQAKDLQSRYQTAKTNLISVFQNLNLTPNDLPQKERGLFGYLSRGVPNADAGNIAKPNSYVLKTMSGEIVKPDHRFPDELRDALNQFLKEQDEIAKRYFVVNSKRKNFHNLALLQHVADALEKIKEKDNIVRISEFNAMIARLIAAENAPFIYERIGTRLQHYLLDEFQDTSRLQWNNLIPLVYDAISQQKENLIVGDPKQAIYRFRNGLVEQFVALPGIYNPEKDKNTLELSNYFESMGYKKPLDTNFRSKKDIIDFNNHFFEEAVELMPAEFKHYYSDVKQNIKNEEYGYVQFKLHEKSLKNDFESLLQEYLINTIAECEKDGYNRGDICILVRGKKTGGLVAKVLNAADEKFKIVSADSLTVSSDKAVQLIVQYMKLRRNATNTTVRLQFAVTYLQFLEQDPIEILNDFWVDFVGNLNWKAFVEKHFKDLEKLFFTYDSLYDLGQQFARLIHLSEINSPYVHHFMEMLVNYDVQFGPDLRGFLENWDTKGKQETVQIPKSKDALEIMTVHKSKGLEFPVVIMPNLADFDFSRIKDSMFIELKEQGIIYTNLTKESSLEEIEKEYLQERSQLFLDEMNLLYVAFTRPVDRLYVLGFDDAKKKDDISNIEQLMAIAIHQMKKKGVIKQSNNCFEFGEKCKRSKEMDSTAIEAFIPTDLKDFLWFPELAIRDEEAIKKESLEDERVYGNIFHQVIALINDIDDFENVLTTLNSTLSTSLYDKYSKRLSSDLKNIKNDLKIKTLYSEAEKIISEKDILVGQNKVLRPDKIFYLKDRLVVLDFKTGKAKTEDNQQLSHYINVISELTDKAVEGELYYTGQNTLL